MGYQINKRKKKDGTSYWRIVFREVRDNVNHDRHIPIKEYSAHGFSISMSIEEARVKATKLNADNTEARREQRKKVRAGQRAKKNASFKSSQLPDALVAEFEGMYLKKYYAIGPNAESKYRKVFRPS